MRNSFVGLAILTGFACGLMIAPSGNGEALAKSKKRMTCSFIAKQCRRECRKEAPPDFCDLYCNDKRAECLRTGEWSGIRRYFDKVIRK
ncbi:MAG: hypothetical protein RIC14_01820 [Filomicrobium sp.]